MNVSDAIAALKNPDGAMTIPVATRTIPCAPGIYSIFVDDPAVLPEPFRGLLSAKGTRLLYVGIATKSLSTRLIEQELKHKNAATFFRGIGAALGYRPARGSLRDKVKKAEL